MPDRRRGVLALLLGVVGLLVAAIIADVLWTVFFAITVAYVLVPFDAWLTRRGLPAWWAALVSTLTAFLAVALLMLPIAFTLYLRRRQLSLLLDAVPDRVELTGLGVTYVIEAGDVTALASRYVTRLALDLARATPGIAAKATVFAFVVFALLLRGDRIRDAGLALAPPRFHDVVLAIHDRVRGTLNALYVIQAATAFATFVVALVVFVAFGYRFPIALAVIAGLLQFLPVVGPSIVVASVALFELGRGDPVAAVTVFVVGIIVIGVLPDAILRPRMAAATANLPASLYFVGFTGGILSVGAIGIIAGPLAIAVLAEVVLLLSAEMSGPSGAS